MRLFLLLYESKVGILMGFRILRYIKRLRNSVRGLML